jgi:hypothetical protein
MRETFAEFGIPRKIVSEHGPHFQGDMTRMCNELGIQQKTSSPHHPKSKGQAERTIQTVKKIMKKTLKAREDVNVALLEYCTTPIDAKIGSPAEILFGRQIRSTLQSLITNCTPDRDVITESLQLRQERQCENYNATAKDLPPLEKGKLDTGKTIRRNRIHLRPASSPTPNDGEDKNPTPSKRAVPTSSTVENIEPPGDEPVAATPPATPSYRTKSGREVKPPRKLDL